MGHLIFRVIVRQQGETKGSGRDPVGGRLKGSPMGRLAEKVQNEEISLSREARPGLGFDF